MKPQDFDRLSAYIDHQLSPAEQAALEQRLGREPELRAALSELRLTVKAVRSLPMVKPPRSFTLTAAQAGLPSGTRRPRPGSLFGSLRLAATLSAVALALVVGGDFAATRGLLGTRAAPAEEVLFTAESSPSEAAAQAALTPSPEAELSVMAAEAGTGTPAAEALPSGEDGAQAPEATAAVAALAPETPTVTPSTERMLADATAVADVAAADEATPSTKVVPPADATPAADSALATGESAEQTPPGFPPLRLLEAALAMLTVLLGLGAWLASRNAA